MEGMADDENPFPLKVDVRHKVHELGGCPTKGTRADDCPSHLASSRARAAGDFGTLHTQERQTLFADAN